jgi:LysR family transcriptional activator of nhaA
MYLLNYQHLKYFWAVSRHGHLTRASEELHLTPQTISAQIRELENGLGEKLFNRRGRSLVLTEAGQVVFRYADEIFSLGQELQDVLRGLPGKEPLRLSVGIADVVPKMIAHHLINPAMHLDNPLRITCREGHLNDLLSELAVHKLDIVLADSPIPTTVRIKAYNHFLGECGITFMASSKLAARLRKGFPQSLDGAPFLVPMKGCALRQKLDEWFESHNLRPLIAGEFEDSALLQVFGQTGSGFFAVPSVLESEVARQYQVKSICRTDSITECFYAISAERRVRHPAVTAICRTGQSLF